MIPALYFSIFFGVVLVGFLFTGIRELLQHLATKE